ncbi:hypothetical protein EMPS_06408 [Entomortierella parvispora]|uniref:Uncharacterized protein n=1 Tax=Entomortierella parvispora TaxID=205924 RepID=A0A9P3LXP9_9FUNG|nr:hypothetical protein EMPS_06408 [Entomortierella parvispora]
MSQKGFETQPDQNQEGMSLAPPPSYATTTQASGGAKYEPPSGAPPTTESYYQAQPTQQQYAPPAGAYIPPSGAYAPPAGQPHTVVYVVDGAANSSGSGGIVGGSGAANNPHESGIPTAMICFIFGLCTWVGYLFGMCFLRSSDPRERYWARACFIMCIIWSLIIIFASIFGRHGH